ncbi:MULTISPECIES: DivIVA domain-containing protein [unclassified Kribbella]|uniref:DivIVA domain-containing protein n=1 Tax=unclassified Kribbella TaxID=2644121 RepID=UPI0033F0EBC2
MTHAIHEATAGLSPRSVREAQFSHRMRGLDEAEVRSYLHRLADQIQQADADRARLRAEIESLREKLGSAGPEADSAGISPQAIALFSQAQQVADSLVAEAVEHARDMMTATRAQERQILERARGEAQRAARDNSAAASLSAEPGADPVPHVPEVEYVRTFARVAQVQLKSVLDALAEQVDRLTDVTSTDQPDSVRRGSHSLADTILTTQDGLAGAAGSRDPNVNISWRVSADTARFESPEKP